MDEQRPRELEVESGHASDVSPPKDQMEGLRVERQYSRHRPWSGAPLNYKPGMARWWIQEDSEGWISWESDGC